MARTVPAAIPLPDPARMLSSLPMVASDWQNLARTVNKLNADPGTPPIRQSWIDYQATHTGAVARYHTWPLPEWSPQHTARGLECRVKTAAFGGAGAVVTFKSAATGNVVTCTPAAGGGWADSATRLVCDFTAGWDEVEMHVETAAGALTWLAVSCVWDELPDPLAAGLNGSVIPLDDLEVAADQPLSARLGRVVRTSLDAIEDRVSVYACYSGLEGVVSGGVDCSYMNPGWKWLYANVHPGTRANLWNLTYRIQGAANGYLDMYHGTEQDAAEQGSAAHTEVDFSAGAPPQWKTGSFRLQEIQLASNLAPIHMTDINIVPRSGADAEVTSLAIWGR